MNYEVNSWASGHHVTLSKVYTRGHCGELFAALGISQLQNYIVRLLLNDCHGSVVLKFK